MASLDFGSRIPNINNSLSDISRFASTSSGKGIVSPVNTGKGYLNGNTFNAVSAYAGLAQNVASMVSSSFGYNTDTSGALTTDESKARRRQNASSAGNTVSAVVGTVLSILALAL